MVKDWNFWRLRYIGYIHDRMSHNLKKIGDLNLTPIEKIVHAALNKLQDFYGIYHLWFTPQFKLNNYIVDFIVTFETPGQQPKNIIIECDGHEFHEKTKEQASKDKKRDRELQKLGYVVLRYSGSDICNDPSVIMADLAGIFGQPDWAKGDDVK